MRWYNGIILAADDDHSPLSTLKVVERINRLSFVQSLEFRKAFLESICLILQLAKPNTERTTFAAACPFECI